MRILAFQSDHESQSSYFVQMSLQSISSKFVIRKQETNMEEKDPVNTRVELYAWIFFVCCFARQ
jgi:hypothetical protein